MSSVLAGLYPDISPSHVHLVSCWWQPLFFIVSSSDLEKHYFCRWTAKLFSAKLPCNVALSASPTSVSFLTHTVKVISYPPLQHPVKWPWPRQKTRACPHLSPTLHYQYQPQQLILFFVLVWPVSLFCFMGLIVSLSDLDKVLCSRICHSFSSAAQTKTNSRKPHLQWSLHCASRGFEYKL